MTTVTQTDQTDQTDQKDPDEKYLKSAPVSRAIIHLSIPMMLAMSVGVVYGIINAFFIGSLHNTSMLAALTYGLPVFVLTLAVGSVFGVGGSTYISRLMGSGEKEKIKHVSAFTLYGGLIFGAILTVLSIIFINPLVNSLGVDSASFSATKDYAFMLLLWIPVFIASSAMEQIVRATGAAKQSMYGMIFGTIANLIFDVLFILILHMGVGGAALAMGASNLVSLIYYLWHLHNSSRDISLSIRDFRLNFDLFKKVFGIGVSDLLQSAFILVATLTLNHVAVIYGDSLLAAFGVALRITQLPEALAMGVFIGIMPLIAYSYGNKNFARMHSAMRQASLWIAGIVVIFSGIVFTFREQIFSWFTNSPQLLTFGVAIMTAMLVSTLFNGFTGLFMAYFQATEKALAATILSVIQGIILVPGIILGSLWFGVTGVIWSMPASELAAFIIAILLFFVPFRKQSTSETLEPNIEGEIERARLVGEMAG